MSQRTLDKWLNIKPNKKKDGNANIKKYFYLDWSSGFVPTDAVWLYSKPNNINFEQTIGWDKLKKGSSFVLCGNFPDIDKKFILEKEKKYWNVPYLKSHLQKCARQMEILKGLKTASHFIHLDLVAFLRRLPIIMIEDVYLHKSFTTIIWLMVAVSSTEFKMKNYIIEYLLGIVYIICSTKVHDELNEKDKPIENNIEFISKSNNLKDNECSLIYSLILRKHYGGMSCDMIMIDKYIYKWYERFNSNKYETNILNEPVNPIEDNLEDLLLDEWILEAVDFHCSNILSYLVKKYNFFTENELKEIIWHSLSRKNKRINQKNKYEREFNKIKEYIPHVQKFLLLSNY